MISFIILKKTVLRYIQTSSDPKKIRTIMFLLRLILLIVISQNLWENKKLRLSLRIRLFMAMSWPSLFTQQKILGSPPEEWSSIQ